MAQRPWIWLQLTIGWLPVGALLAVLIYSAHANATLTIALTASFRLVISGAILGVFVRRLAERFPWHARFSIRFVALHVVAAGIYAIAWVLLNSLVESALRGALVLSVGVGIVPFLVLGVWLYVMIAGVSYAMAATERMARAEALAAESQLEALRAQLHPHFLFNTLHTVVQLIPREPKRAALAAEQLAGLLRRAIEETRDLVSVAEELAFVDRYLEIERLRFGERLLVETTVSEAASQAEMPAFALLTLVENAVRHGAEPNINPTTISVSATVSGTQLIIAVTDNGVGTNPSPLSRTTGTGLKRLTNQLLVLYERAAHLDVAGTPGGGFTASLALPLRIHE